jgi:aspartyl/glutamyl-tRNA(Asn/Gln) amidotransferase C subunit
VSVSREQVHAIAALAKLRVSDAEAETFAVQLSDILDHVEALAAAETDRAGDDSTPSSVPLRPDSPTADPLHTGPATFAPAWAEGFFTVPRLAAMDTEEPSP